MHVTQGPTSSNLLVEGWVLGLEVFQTALLPQKEFVHGRSETHYSLVVWGTSEYMHNIMVTRTNTNISS